MNKFRKLMRILANRTLVSTLLRYGVAASVEHAEALKPLRCDMVVDLGANRGQFSLLARQLYPSAAIVAFEPLPGPAGVYRKVFAQDSKVKLHAMAVGAVAGEQEMHISARDDCSSLLPIARDQLRVYPGTHETGSVLVHVEPLQQVLGEKEMVSPALLKLDVQGFELEALRGCEALLPWFEYIYCECSFMEMYQGQPLADAIIAWLNERGFRLGGVYNVAYDSNGKSVQADLLFEQAVCPPLDNSGGLGVRVTAG